MKLLIINGPNLNKLGSREPDIYGHQSFDDFFSHLQFKFKSVALSQFQSNIEGEIVTAIQKADEDYDGIIINAAAYSHTSIAIADALKMVKIEAVEVHISNVFSREGFRHHSYIAPYVKGVIVGLGLKGYELAIHSFLENE